MRSTALPSWAFRALVVTINLAGIWWIHHDLVGAALPGVRVLAALPARDVDRADRFTLVFDRPLSLPGAPGEARLAAHPFTLLPQMAGAWFWAAPEKLEYRFEKPLPPGRRFKLSAGPSAEQVLGRKLLGRTEFLFETRPLALITAAVTSADGEHANIELEFNQPVDPGDLTRHMRVSDRTSDRRIDAHVLNKSPDSKLTLRASRPPGDKLTLQLGGTLAGAGAELPLGREVSNDMDISSAFTVVKAEVELRSFESNTSVNLRFSKALHAEKRMELQRCVEVSPTVEGLQVLVHPYDDRSLVLRGPFRNGQSYVARVSADLTSCDDEKLGREETVSFHVPDRGPAVRFDTGGGILSRSGNLIVDLEHVNLPTIQLQAGRVHANNLVSHLRGEARAGTAREFPEKAVALDAPPNTPTTAGVDLRKLLGDPLGLYWLEVRGPAGTWTDDSTVVAVTDLAITSKQERNGFVVWVTSLSTARPVAGAEVTALTYNNQTVSRATTDGDGLARLDAPTDHPDGTVWVITAQLGNDVSYIEPQERPWVLDDIDTSGRASPVTYDVMLYPERGVYRPGEPIHLTGIIRDAVGNVPPEFPLAMTVSRPDGKEIAELPISPGTAGQGVFQLDYSSPDVGQTGAYTFRVRVPGGKDVLGEVEALVEDYVPQRLDLRATSAQGFGPGEPVQVEAAARYLFDQPATGLELRVSGRYRREVFVSERFAAFAFTPADARAEQSLAEQRVALDAEGRATVTVVPPSGDHPGLWHGAFRLTVSEEGGRSVTRNVETRVDTAGRYVGLHLPTGRVVPAGVPVDVEYVQVTGQDEPAASDRVTYSLVRVQHDTTLQQVDGRYVWKTIERTTLTEHGELEPSAEQVGRFQILCPDAGLYRLSMTDCRSGSTARIELQGTTDPDRPAATGPAEPDRVLLVLDRESYTPGSVARLALESPFTGTLLLSVETDRVIHTRVVDLLEPAVQLDLPVDAGLRGGAFITATVVRRIDPQEQTWLPHRAMGMTRLRTDHADRRLQLTLDAPAQVRPGEMVSVHVQTEPLDGQRGPAVVHVWAVDEGILLASDYKTPDPLLHFFEPRTAEIISADVFGDLMPDQQRPAGMARIGGDGGDDEAYRRRLTPAALPRQTPAVIWRTAVPVASNGTLAADFIAPQMTGKLRIMAVAVDGDRYGSAGRPIVVTTPLLVEMSCPRFAAPDDLIELPIKVFNCTQAELDVRLDVTAAGPLRLEGLPREPFRVHPAEPVTVWARAVATGLGSVSLVATAEATASDGETVSGTQRSEFGVRPAGPLHAETRIVSIHAGDRYEAPVGEQFLPSTARTTLTIGPRPTVHLQQAVEELIDYPYGCVEQTTSRLYVLLHAPDLLGLQAGADARRDSILRMIDAGISRLWSMQTRSGGLSYWPGDVHASAWGSVYAAEFISLATRQGHSVAPPFVSELTRYLEALLDNGDSEEVDGNLRAHVCCVLTRMDRPQPGWMNRLSETADKLDLAGRAHLAGAWIEMGRRDRAAVVLSDDVLTQMVPVAKTVRPSSRVHQDAVLLSVLMDLDAHHRLIPTLVQRLEKARADGHWGSTLDNAAALAALARYQLGETSDAAFEGIVRQGETARPFDHSGTQSFSLDGDRPVEVTSSGKGSVYLSLTTEGLLAQPVQQEYDRGLVVSRRWLNRAGEPLDTKTLRVGDLVRVEVSLAAPGLSEGEVIEHVAVVDALPAGLEVENPRLAGSEGSDDSQVGSPDRVEFRDDRVVIFASAAREQRVFRYALRAMAAGSFVVPPVQASCMYDGSTASLHAGGRVVIVK